MMNIDRVEVDEKHRNVIHVYDNNDARRSFLEKEGILYSGRLYIALWCPYRVHLFLPFLDGLPTVLFVERYPDA